MITDSETYQWYEASQLRALEDNFEIRVTELWDSEDNAVIRLRVLRGSGRQYFKTKPMWFSGGNIILRLRRQYFKTQKQYYETRR
jgi:hypothetical protein